MTPSPSGGDVSTPPATQAAGAAPVPLPASAAALPPAVSAEIVRLADAGMGPDALGAKFRLAYKVLNRIVTRERKRRADAWARGGPSLGWAERRAFDGAEIDPEA
ncbi:MAG TPA: hypothetical protein ENH55_16655 [Aurantimonas coralicida]|uniref:Uncharacterized protein n=1 Tax=Aurantimonas coralicida TaxID=182270 RepID=A0A9C9NFB4_9HYPH|nr:hypothetical protein [Aurantimonas coralicida]HEU00536.1 hypothetical protein [Aurantimonas coralicida]